MEGYIIAATTGSEVLQIKNLCSALRSVSSAGSLAYNTKCDTKHDLNFSPKTVTFKLDAKSMAVEVSLLSFSKHLHTSLHQGG